MFTLPFSNGSGLASFLAAVTDPRSTEYRHFLSYEQFEARFAPSSTSLRTLERTLLAAGASSVASAPGGLAVDATLPAASVERLLGVSLIQFTTPALTRGYTALGEPRLPDSLSGLVMGVDGLASLPGPVRSPILAEPAAPRLVAGGPGQYILGNSGPGIEWFLGSDFTQAYEAAELLPGNRSVPHATYPGGVAIATILASGYNATNLEALPPWSPSVVDDYFNDTFPAAWPLPTLHGVPVPEPGAATPPLPGSFHGENDSTGFVVENSLDLEMAGSLAPGSSLYNFYFSGALTVGPATFSNVAGYLADDLAAALSYDYGPAHLAVVSCSCGVDDLNDSHWNQELQVAAATGVTVVASSGDEGNAPSELTGRQQNQWPLWPATAANNTSGTISIGGVSIALSGVPTGRYTLPPLVVRYDPNVEGFANTSAWWDTSGGLGAYAGSEGGTSLLYAEPWWQFHSAAEPAIVNATEVEGFDRLGRAGPDVAFPANNTIAFISAAANGTPYAAVLGGTSVAAPVFAGLLADVVGVENATRGGVTGLGYLDPELYRIGSYYAAHPGSSDPFLPVLYGANELFSAGPGWTPVTGWGGLSAPLFLEADENSTVANYTYTGPTPTLPPASSPSVPIDWVVVVVFAGAVAVVATATVLWANRARRRVGVARPAPYAWPPNPARPAPPDAGAFATFSCPFCGVERPSEPGHCPGCGAM